MTGHSKRSVERSRYDNYEAASAARPVVPSGSAYHHLLAPQTTRAAVIDGTRRGWPPPGLDVSFRIDLRSRPPARPAGSQPTI